MVIVPSATIIDRQAIFVEMVMGFETVVGPSDKSESFDTLENSPSLAADTRTLQAAKA